MNRADTEYRKYIIRMAREAGFREPNPHDGCMGIAYDYRDGTDTGASLERFAALVASAAQAKEREACAKVCEEYETNNDIAETWLNIVSEVIRARGQA